MANEVLTRTPTSSGNRKKFTWAGWIKRNDIDASGGNSYQGIFSVGTVDGAEDTFMFSSDQIRLRCESGSDVTTSQKYRDSGNWMHVMMVVDTTLYDPDHRCIFYVNGVKSDVMTQESDITQNATLRINSADKHYLGEFPRINNHLDGQIADVFLVDGQALTPDVFGFYKDGDGYMSSGTSNATDFRPGQWSPHSPTKIKKDINRRGGFGVNGFYLPMNDSSNPGADFHCAPNSIIKLKGEDLPQPRNGAPTTSDAYVSQLRSDPFAANIVLAVPGIAGGQGSGYGDYSADIKGSGTNKTITANNNASVAGDLGGYYGSAMTFDGTTDSFQISVPNNDPLFLQSDFTIECWANIAAGQTDDRYFLLLGSGASSNAQGSYYLRMFQSKYQGIFVNSNNQYQTTSTNNYVANQWNHIAYVREGNQQTLYINGVCESVTSHTLLPNVNNSSLLYIGSAYGLNNSINAQIQDVRIYNGIAKYKGGFDVPKPYTPVGIEAFRTTTDTCKNNFATLSPLSYQTSGTYGTSYPVLTDGNLRCTHGQTGQWERSNCTMGASEGKWYFEFQKVDGAGLSGSYENWAVGLRESDSIKFHKCTDGFESNADHSYWLDAGTAKIVSNSVRGGGATSGISDVVNGDIINIAFEKTATALKVWFGKNGTYFNSGNPATGANPAVNHATTTEYIIPAVAFYQYSGQTEPVGVLNFGQNPTFSGQVTAGTNADGNGKGLFKYAPPTGFLALCEDNLPTPAIADPGKYFKTVLYTGNGTNGTDGSQSIRKVGFQPDLVWVKKRGTAGDNKLIDSVRGVALVLESNTTDVEGNENNNFTGFNSDGFDLGANNAGAWNENGYGYVAWCWKAGGAAVSNSDGSITSQVSANQTAGFSIVNWTSNAATSVVTIGHGLAKTPKFMLLRNRNLSDNWFVYHSAIQTNNNQYLRLNTSDGTITSPNDFWSTSSSTFGIRQSSIANNGNNCIAYCWAEIEGFSKFGSYTGNNSADGPFVYCGFKPAWVLIKKTNGSGNENWRLFDSSRCPTNQNNKHLLPSTPSAESTETGMDFLSNGFKLRHADAHQNQNGTTYIFSAFAESPFQTANAK